MSPEITKQQNKKQGLLVGVLNLLLQALRGTVLEQ